MIAVSALQFSAGKSLAGKRTSECAAGLLSSCAKRRHRCEQKYWDQLVHATVLEQRPSRRPVHSRPRSPGFSQRGQDVRSASALAFSRVLLGAEKVQRRVRLIANDPTVVWHGRNIKQIACAKLNYATMIECNCRGSRENKPDVFNR